jgi:beta-glucanase (GH16 family)
MLRRVQVVALVGALGVLPAARMAVGQDKASQARPAAVPSPALATWRALSAVEGEVLAAAATTVVAANRPSAGAAGSGASQQAANTTGSPTTPAASGAGSASGTSGNGASGGTPATTTTSPAAPATTTTSPATTTTTTTTPTTPPASVTTPTTPVRTPTTPVTPAPSGPPSSSQPWTLAFNDTFAGSSLDTSDWATCYPWMAAAGCTNNGNNELEWYAPSQAEVSDNELHLVADKTPTAGESSSGAPMSYSWTSGMVTTFKSFDFTYGYVQIVAKIPKGDGLWPALWLLPQSESWPPEIDIMENWGNDSLRFTYHQTASTAPNTTLESTEDLSAGFHTYAVDWEPGSITWYLDGAEVFQVTTGVPSQPMYFLANLAVDSSADASTPASASFDIKSVQVWQH